MTIGILGTGHIGQAIMERVGDSTTNPDAGYAVRLTRALFT